MISQLNWCCLFNYLISILALSVFFKLLLCSQMIFQSHIQWTSIPLLMHNATQGVYLHWGDINISTNKQSNLCFSFYRCVSPFYLSSDFFEQYFAWISLLSSFTLFLLKTDKHFRCLTHSRYHALLSYRQDNHTPRSY